MLKNRRPVWNSQPNLHGNLTERGLFYADRMKKEIDSPPDNWLVFDERYKTPSIEPAAMEPDNGNGWYDPKTKTLHFVVATQCPLEAATETAKMIAPSRFGLANLNMHPGYTVGYGSKTTTSSSTTQPSRRCTVPVCRSVWRMTAMSSSRAASSVTRSTSATSWRWTRTTTASRFSVPR